ncbi:hypothetical protein BMR02_04415 [Methylococcaceae bacterium HT1]|nr:hypothetical protein BMR02_04415 [Methylococcaceae bacterium HT1]TXL13828.1 hypothetical protein BMR05_09970 [Methylococcaceae bacterium HT4]TXL19347.1 hypothetical protein BMR06_10520 [Methylococcaceae bacterium HT5]TXL22963.1 hypothetical protein BMR03_04970 [Methylococcaceae bacterium HT2]
MIKVEKSRRKQFIIVQTGVCSYFYSTAVEQKDKSGSGIIEFSLLVKREVGFIKDSLKAVLFKRVGTKIEYFQVSKYLRPRIAQVIKS